MITKAQAYALRRMIEKAASSLPDEDALSAAIREFREEGRRNGMNGIE